MLVAAFTPEEIHKTLLSLPNGTVPGLDGYTKEFFVAVLPIVGRDLVVAIQSFFSVWLSTYRSKFHYSSSDS